MSRFESELTIRQSVEADIVGLRKLIDDTNMGRMNLESEIEALKEELIHLKKNHDNVSPHYRLYETQSHGKNMEPQWKDYFHCRSSPTTVDFTSLETRIELQRHMFHQRWRYSSSSIFLFPSNLN